MKNQSFKDAFTKLTFKIYATNEAIKKFDEIPFNHRSQMSYKSISKLQHNRYLYLKLQNVLLTNFAKKLVS